MSICDLGQSPGCVGAAGLAVGAIPPCILGARRYHSGFADSGGHQMFFDLKGPAS